MHMAIERQASALPPAQPSYILRGHAAQIHSVRFVRQNSRLLTGDADGWVVYWKVETKRALAVWNAHGAAILGTEEWGHDRLITHGRDNSLRIWQLRASDENALSTVLPTEDATTPRPKPWLLHTLPVNTLNFCAFSTCHERLQEITAQRDDPGSMSKSTTFDSASILVATPSTDDKKINVYQFPEEKLKFVVPKVATTDTGMVMAIKLVHHHNSKSILVLAGYEGGLTAVHQLPCGHSSNVGTAKLVYLSQPHTQPILAIDICPDVSTYFTSSADAVIAAHRIPELFSSAESSKETLATVDESAEGVCGPAVAAEGLQDEVVAPKAAPSTGDRLSPSDQVVGSDLTSEVQPVSFRKQTVRTTQAAVPRSAGLSSLLSSATPQSGPLSPPTALLAVTLQPPHKTINTKHAGQQSLRVRSDGRILVTGGWDSRIRIYSTKTLKEVAVMKWHKQGVYAVDFAEVLEPGSLRRRDEAANEAEGEVVRGKTGLGRLQRQREEQLQLKHWVVAGAKDGKVSLWEVF